MLNPSHSDQSCRLWARTLLCPNFVTALRRFSPRCALGGIETASVFSNCPPNRSLVAIGTRLTAVSGLSIGVPDNDAEFEDRAIVDFEQPVGDVNLVVKVQ